jgi:hypothetical protein
VTPLFALKSKPVTRRCKHQQNNTASERQHGRDMQLQTSTSINKHQQSNEHGAK